MKKSIIKTYAQVLYNSTKGKNEDEIKELIAAFARLLAGEKMLGQAEAVLAEFGRIWNREEGVVEAEIRSARELDDNTIKVLEQYIKEISKSKKVQSRPVEDKKMLGGVVLRYRDKVVDGSLRTALRKLRAEMEA